VGETSWLFLLVGSFAAVGAAMALGTLAALLRYQRTGQFPGSEEVAELPRRRLVALWVRVAVGLVLTIIGIIALVRAGLL
jgi:predicted lysophospholipase L1 biosynthesis ABC-type transport system permease subunit